MMTPFTEFGIGDLKPKPKYGTSPGGLTIELVPMSSWGDNLRSRLATKDWDKLRRAQYASALHHCEICGGQGPRHPVECHEIWEYNDESHVQKLGGLIALCPDCHGVKHIGRSLSIGRGDRAIAHLMLVNGWDLQTAETYIAGAFRQHAERSKDPWTLDLSWLADHGVKIPH